MNELELIQVIPKLYSKDEKSHFIEFKEDVAIVVFNLPMAFITVIAFFFGGYYIKNIKMRSDRKEKKEK